MLEAVSGGIHQAGLDQCVKSELSACVPLGIGWQACEAGSLAVNINTECVQGKHLARHQAWDY